MSSNLDRREFLVRTGAIGAAGAVAATHWVAPAITGASSAFASTSCLKEENETALSGWTRSGTGGTGTTLTKSYAASGGKPALTVQFATTVWDNSRVDANNLSVQTGSYSYSGGTSPHILMKGTPDSGTKGSSGTRGWIEVVLTFSVGVTNLRFDIENIAGFGLLSVYRAWHVWMSGVANTDPPPAFTYTTNDATTTGEGTQSSPWNRNDKSYGSASVSMVGTNASPITYLKFHFDMWRGWADASPNPMDAGIANLKFCR